MAPFEFRPPPAQSGTLSALLSQQSQAQEQAALQRGNIWQQTGDRIGGTLAQLAMAPSMARKQQADEQERQMKLAIQGQQLSEMQEKQAVARDLGPLIKDSLEPDGRYNLERFAAGVKASANPRLGMASAELLDSMQKANDNAETVRDRRAGNFQTEISAAARGALSEGGTIDALGRQLFLSISTGRLKPDMVQSVMAQAPSDPAAQKGWLVSLTRSKPEYKEAGGNLFQIQDGLTPSIVPGSGPKPEYHNVPGVGLVQVGGPTPVAPQAAAPAPMMSQPPQQMPSAARGIGPQDTIQPPDEPSQPMPVTQPAPQAAPPTGPPAPSGAHVVMPSAPTTNAQHIPLLVDGRQVMGAFVPDAKGGRYLVNGVDVTDRAKPIPPVVTQISATQGDEAKAIAEAIIAGDQPPDVKGLYRYGGPVRAELAKQGYNLTTANLDWEATKKHLATLNGAQQTRIRQAISTASDSLDVIQTLADQWKGGRFPILNKGNLIAAKNGLYGQDVASVATKLDGQITDVVSELANVYMGGNSPTDHAMKLAEKNLNAEWDQKVLTDMIALARTNLKIRANSISNSGAVLSGGQSTSPAAAPPVEHWGFDDKGNLVKKP